jgi:hypothetical protein
MKLASHIDKIVSSQPKRWPNWYDKLEDGDKKELDAVRSRYKQGGYGKTSKRAIAKAIAAAAKERGLQICSETGLRLWLADD